MRIIGHMVIRNELGRSITTTLPCLKEICNGAVAVYDDQSTDGTDIYVKSLDIACARREDVIPAFREHESRFRWAAWRFMEQTQAPQAGDWILAVDADELLLVPEPGADVELARITHLLIDAIAEAEFAGHRSISFRVAEIFGFDVDGWPMQRTDGYWATITACRLARWTHEGIFDSRTEAGGSIPSAWLRDSQQTSLVELFHLGYARPEDRVVKYERYRHGMGHNRRHVESILTEPSLTRWAGMRPLLPYEPKSRPRNGLP
jgi:hypothetical protein